MWRVMLVLLCSVFFYSCADDDFFQHDALSSERQNGEAAASQDSAWVTVGRHYDRSSFHRFFWGNHNRALWSEPVKLPIFKLNAVKGGLKVVDIGGGYQTTSFELQDSAGRHYALRSLDKDPVHVVSKFWQQTFVANILRDQTSAANPFGALVVPALAEAVGVYHSNPELYYISTSDKSFGRYSTAVQGKVFMLEEKYENTSDITPDLKGVLDFEDSEDMLQKRFASNSHHVDQLAFARARLLDLLIGDWDRHKGQWEWAVIKNGADTYYKPIPKDRDQVFLKMQDGVIPFIATNKLLARKFHSFDDDFSDVKAYMINAAFVDARFLNELSLSQWQQTARHMQQQLTDQVINKAVSQLPKQVYALVGEKIASNLKSRRDQLPDAASKMYEILAKQVVVPGSDEVEHFRVDRLDDEHVEVIVLRPASSALPAKQIYHRVFNRKETELIILRGLAGKDKFIITGNVRESIPVKAYGGLGEDKIIDSSVVKGWKKYTLIYDTSRGNEIIFGSEAKDMTTDDVRVHAFDREGN
ncbi:hypothetical protein [Pontibacter oryzae]|uniref:Uncharacterized protein n=1 Tax=Pontibacter oryzae TaxID=2304593 RepID=A0A399SDZ3_9BACT|nr:hypothetical protein [Pontibacter oryzae]RIJ41900.1 hypothetical protein D1627_07795 [Pontibacter oryzae]